MVAGLALNLAGGPGVLAVALVGALHDASAVPMDAAFALCAIAAKFALRLGKREALA